MLTVVSPEACEHLLSRLVDLGDCYYDYTNKLIEDGFVSLKAALDLNEGLAEDAAELAFHRFINVEKSKESFVNLNMMIPGWPVSSSYPPPYQSAFLSALRLEKTKEQQTAGRENMKSRKKPEVDPLRLRYEAMSYESQNIYEHRNRKEFLRLRDEEIKRFISNSSRPKLDLEEARNFAYEKLGLYLENCNFRFNRSISSRTINYIQSLYVLIGYLISRLSPLIGVVIIKLGVSLVTKRFILPAAFVSI